MRVGAELGGFCYRLAAFVLDARMPTSEEQVKALVLRADLLELKENDQVVKNFPFSKWRR